MLTCALNKEPIQIETPGYQVRTYLHIEDFISAFDRVLIKLFKGVRGIYNLGSSEEISFKRLADSIWQLTNPGVADVPVKLITPKGRSVWWIVPDITRIQALLNWKPQITIRRGLWTLVSEGQQNGHHEQAVSVASR
jgi:nucleoside-diphosphate-sugar epimerase